MKRAKVRKAAHDFSELNLLKSAEAGNVQFSSSLKAASCQSDASEPAQLRGHMPLLFTQKSHDCCTNAFTATVGST